MISFAYDSTCLSNVVLKYCLTSVNPVLFKFCPKVARLCWF